MGNGYDVLGVLGHVLLAFLLGSGDYIKQRAIVRRTNLFDVV